MSSVWEMILQWGSTIKVSIELPVATRHRRDMTEKMWKATLNPNSHTHLPNICKSSTGSYPSTHHHRPAQPPSHGMGGRKFVQTALVTRPRWPPCPYMVKTLKNLPKGRWPWKLVCSMFKWWPWVDLGYFTARSNSVPYAFVWEKKVKQWIFQKLLLSMIWN